MKGKRNNVTLRKILSIIGVIAVIIIVIVIVIAGRHYLTRKSIRTMSGTISSYGTFAPFIVVFLIFISTAIPPLPLPVPIVEIAAGYLFGFLPGFLLVWFSQIISSLFAFGITRVIGNRLFRSLHKNRIFLLYQQYVFRSGAMGVFFTRATMAAPFNIVSFLAGLTDIRIVSFLTATMLGTIPESLLYSFIGSIIHTTRLRLWYIFIAVVLLGSIVPVYVFTRINRQLLKKNEKKR